MRKLLLVLLILFSFAAYSQTLTIKPNRFQEFGGRTGVKQTIAGMGLSFVSGFSTGVRETILFHPWRFEKRFPNADPQYWDPFISWENKYRRGYPQLGPKYPGSTTYLAWTTDLYHLTNTTSRASLVLASATFTIGERKKWWVYATRLVAGGVAHTAGFQLSYNLIFHN